MADGGKYVDGPQYSFYIFTMFMLFFTNSKLDLDDDFVMFMLLYFF